MNKKQRSSNDEPNRNPNPANEKQLAEHTARVLELQPLEAQSQDDQATVELGRLLRDAAQANLPASSLDLRKQLMAELDGGSSAAESDQVTLGAQKLTSSEVVSKGVSSRSTGRRFLIAAAASGLLLVGGAIAYNSNFVGTLSNVALLDEVEQPDVDPVADRSASSSKPDMPEVMFRMETKTRQVPVTRMTTQTKTRMVPVQRVRDETRQVKQADGSFKTETVKVPYTEMVQPNYTVQVPIQDNVAQTYQVPVPYTADGKRIEKSEYGKYGLDDDGFRGGQGFGAGDPSEPHSGPRFELELESAAIENGIANEVAEMAEISRGRETTLRRQKFHEFRLRDGQNGQASPSKESSFGQSIDGLGRRISNEGAAEASESEGGAPPEAPPASGSGPADLEAVWLAESKSEISSSSSPEDLSRPAEFMSGGEIPDFAMKNRSNNKAEGGGIFRTKGEAVTGTLLPGVDMAGESVANSGGVRLDLGGDLDKDRRSQGFPGRIGGDAERIAQETRIVEELELQRDQLIVKKNYGPGHAGVSALNLAINERKAKIEQLEKESARYLYYEENTGGEQYEPIFENAFIAAKGPAAISTFSIDVDTASYANMRRMLNSGRRPPPNSIRLEELVNYFQYDYAQPTGEHPFSVNLELADCPWEAGQQLLRVGLKGKDIHVAERPATNVVFLIDVSGSMSSNDKLPLLKSGFQMMSRQLGENDRVSIVTYAGNAGVALEPTNGTQTSTINTAIEQLSSGGSTHGSAGIKLAYELAQRNFIQGGVNRVMLATDGDLNVGVTSDDALVTLIKEKAAEGVFLTVLGFGSGNLKDAKLEKLADNGNGMYAYIDSTREAHRVLVDQLSGSLVTIAKDVKIQVEFNPAEVKSYRLLGYENRMLETKDFDDDAKDAGEIGAGHTVTAIYQIEPAKTVSPNVSLPAGMKYQVKSEADQASVEGKEADKDGLSKAALSGELATVALRYKQPDENESERLEVSIKNQPKRFSEASSDFRFAAGVAGFGMYLRNSEHRGSIDAGLLHRIASESIGKDESGYRSEFIDLIRRASNR